MDGRDDGRNWRGSMTSAELSSWLERTKPYLNECFQERGFEAMTMVKDLTCCECCEPHYIAVDLDDVSVFQCTSCGWRFTRQDVLTTFAVGIIVFDPGTIDS